MFCKGSPESKNMSHTPTWQEVGRMGRLCKMNVLDNRVLKGFPKNFSEDEKTIKYTQLQMKQNSFFADDSEGPSGFHEALGQVV